MDAATTSVTPMDLIFSATFLFTVIRMTTPILFAALGGLITNRCGVMNIALEGMMLCSALTGVLISGGILLATKDANGHGNEALAIILAVIGGLIVGVGIALMLATFAIKLKADIILSGIALNTFSSGITVFIMFCLTGDKGGTASLRSAKVPDLVIPLVKDIPFVGEVLSGHSVLTYLAFVMVAVVYILMFKTSTGLRIRAVGENENAAESVGIKVNNIKFLALGMSGFLAALGGMYMGMSYITGFTRDFVAGRGFIAMSAQNLGRAHPVGSMFASLIFGAADAISIILQALKMPKELLQMMPYAVTLIALLVYSMMRARKLNKIRAQR